MFRFISAIIGKGGTASVLVGLADAKFRRPAHVEAPGLAKRLKETVEQDLRMTLCITSDVFWHQATNSASFVSSCTAESLRRNIKCVNSRLPLTAFPH